jgi:GntR family transcriptional regulator
MHSHHTPEKASDLTLAVSGLSRVSGIPFHVQIRQLLEDEITSGRWGQEARIPSEAELVDYFGVARATVRQALTELQSRGLVRKEPGRGTFVARPRPSAWLLQSARGFFDDALARGHRVTSQVLANSVRELPSWAKESLGANEPRGLVLERLRRVDDEIAMYVVTCLPLRLADAVLEADLEASSLYRLLEREYGVSVAGGHRSVEAAAAEDRLSRLLDVRPGAPLLFVEATSWDAARQPFETYRAWHRAESTRIDIHVAPQPLLQTEV